MKRDQLSAAPTVASQTLAIVSYSPEQTQRLGERLASLLSAGDVLALEGELGSGKTNFVQGLARGLGSRDVVHSPTFVLAHEYRSGRLPLFHVDAYRLAGAAEAYGIGLDDYLNDAGVTAVEWADRILEALPGEGLWITFRYVGETEREIHIQARGVKYESMLNEFQGRAVG